MKYILVCGGVVSGVGKGIVASSIGRVLKDEGKEVTVVKIDPYLNFDAGTLAPKDHGEVFVLEDGTETDLDLGNYERFLGVNLTKLNTITSGRMYQEVIEKERKGEYLGKTVQVVPHLTDHIKASIRAAALASVDGENKTPEVCIIELGGVVGDIESTTFIEALRQMQVEVGKENFLVVGVDLALEMNGEHKTKPIQAAAKRARELGIPYDAVVCRTEKNALCEEVLSKILLFTGVEKCVEVLNGNIMKTPEVLAEQGLLEYINAKLGMEKKRSAKRAKKDTFSQIISPKKHACRVAIVGKYSNHEDAYLSVKASLKFAGSDAKVSAEVEIEYFDAGAFVKEEALAQLLEYDGIVVPGGFGKRGTEEIIKVIGYARVKSIPLLGICLGMQLMAIEYTRSVLGISNATSEEFLAEEDVHTIIDDKINLEKMPEGRNEYLCVIKKHSEAMRIGKQGTRTVKGTKIASIYGEADGKLVSERFRHKYGVTMEIGKRLEEAGLKVGMQAERYIDGIAAEEHPYFVGVQFHPEFLSKPTAPRPLFLSFLQACLEHRRMRRKGTEEA